MNQRELFLRHVAQTSEAPFSGFAIDVREASGCILTGSDGKRYIDLISGIAVSSLGHCHPRVVRAVQEQAEKFMHLMVFGEFSQQPQIEYAQLLATFLPPSLQSVYFTTGGSEAVEGAIKLAKRVTGRYETVSFHNSYHGSTQGAMGLMGECELRDAYRPLIPGNTLLPYNDVKAVATISRNTAAVIVEPVQGEAGVVQGTAAFMRALRKRCDDTGALLLFDEIQTGFGRTGTLFAFEHTKVLPDILLLAKGMGGGMPIGAFVASPEMMSKLASDPALGHMNTFGGNAVCVKAATATLREITEHRLYERANAIGEQLAKVKHPLIREVRVAGALAAIVFKDDTVCLKAVSRCIERGLVTDWFLFCQNALRIAPPLVITDEELREAIEILLLALNEL